jgi:Domain of unknown function (DUF5679)
MPTRRINPNRVKILRNFTARELADRLGVHKNTIRHWQRNGLAAIDGHRPQLFNGATVREFLTSRNKSRKRPCPPGALYCFRCREPRRPIPTTAEYFQMPSGAGDLRGTCGECGTTMHRRTRQEAIHAVLPGVLVQIREVPPRLNRSLSPSPNCDIERQTTA